MVFPSLFLDLYQLTVSCSIWASSKKNTLAVFNLFFRHLPPNFSFMVSCGLHYIMEYISSFKFTKEEIQYLKTLKNSDGSLLFPTDFLEYLENLSLEVDVMAVPEGTFVFPFEPLLRVQGPIIHCILIESALLNIINFQTSVATKASRLFLAADGDPVLDFSLRRARGVDNSIAASRSAYIGGCSFSSNVLFGKMFGNSPKGTQSHTMILLFESELDSFQESCDFSHQCVLLIDTYNITQGIQNAVIIGKKLQSLGKELLGVRIDSGDLLKLSRYVRKYLDQNKLFKTKIYVSGNLCEFTIQKLKKSMAPIDFWGVGSYLVSENTSLDGVYKLACVKYESGGSWQYKMKFSESLEKESLPGALQIYRYFQDGIPILDIIQDEFSNKLESMVCKIGKKELIPANTNCKALLVPIFKKGKRIYKAPSVEEIRTVVIQQLQTVPKYMKEVKNTKKYKVFLEGTLYSTREKLRKELCSPPK